MPSSVLKRASAHYQSLPRRSIDVPEWGDDDGPLTIHWKPWTVAEKRSLYSRADSDEIMLLARIVVMKAEDADGNKLFAKGDHLHLAKQAHDEVVTRIATAITGDRDPDDLEGYAAERDPEKLGSGEALEASEKN